ncbi:MAG TPA: STAS domain-containing protein, partial [Solirubrobacterales bacterium]|nr:STAS domain-containing protein [Solirubrobacterales bacterium]
PKRSAADPDFRPVVQARRSPMALSPRSQFSLQAQPPPVAIRFECICRFDARGSASLELSGELDRAGCELFEARLAEAQRASVLVTLDMRRLTFMDVGGYAILAWAAGNSRRDGKLVLTGCGGQVSRLLDLVGLPERVEISPAFSKADAVPPATRLESEAPIGA